jgi:putative lipoic acid-binding regulatory protein
VQPLEGRPVISYPCSWTYRIVCSDEPALRAFVLELVGTAEHRLTSLGASSGGRYRRVELVLSVRDEAHRNEVFAALSRSTLVRFVL